MKSFEYGDEEIGHREIVFIVSSMVIGMGILSLPRNVAKVTEYYDGWMSIAIGGLFALVFTWINAKLACRFPKQTFFDYTAEIVTKPVSWVITFSAAILYILNVSYEVRGIANISKRYLFDRTPIEAISLFLLLVVIYAVSGTRVALLRINLMFFPIVLGITCLVQVLNIGFFEIDNIRPFFVTSWTGIARGVEESIFSYVGFSVILFYISMMNRADEAPKAAVKGMIIPILLYLLIYTFTIGVFSNEVTSQIIYPTVEIAKEVQVPGEFFERTESIFFTIWIMTIFNTTSMSYDVSLIALHSLFPNVRKSTWIFLLSPLIYFIALVPRNLNEYGSFGEILGYFAAVSGMVIPALLLFIAVARGVKRHEESV
ncbi:GerAB/ArcD/ProY family transporter [Paenibacillus alkalitolerans]|uniref:GerAB/ArcD/ProY family transporter n=1 Tax=Paenibacillus alkalitolerans TaxID=2799335 RepID=UPI0018F46339|nr:endospore germination permease [Paenibacillus alkalitolerans]